MITLAMMMVVVFPQCAYLEWCGLGLGLGLDLGPDPALGLDLVSGDLMVRK